MTDKRDGDLSLASSGEITGGEVVDEGYPGPSNEPCVMGYVVKCPHLVLCRTLRKGEHHACVHWPRCTRSVFLRSTPKSNVTPK